jgi:hypothetical protein
MLRNPHSGNYPSLSPPHEGMKPCGWRTRRDCRSRIIITVMFAEHPSKIDTCNQAADFLKAMSSLSPPEKMFWHVFQCALSVSVSIQVYQKCLFAVLQHNIFDSPCSQCIQCSTSCIHIEFFWVFSWSYHFESDFNHICQFQGSTSWGAFSLGELKLIFLHWRNAKSFYTVLGVFR